MLLPLSDVAEVQQRTWQLYEEELKKWGNQIYFGFLGKQEWKQTIKTKYIMLDFQKQFPLDFALLNYFLLFTLPLEKNLGKKIISQTLWKLFIFFYRVGCSLLISLDLNSTECPPNMPTFPSYLTIWGDWFQSTTPTTLPLLFSLKKRQRWWIQRTDLSFGDREVSFSWQREEGIASVACTHILTFHGLLTSHRVPFRWPELAHSRKATKWGPWAHVEQYWMTWEQIHSDKNIPSQLYIYYKADLLSNLHLLFLKENGEVWIQCCLENSQWNQLEQY